MLRAPHLVPAAQEITHRFILGFGHVNAREFARTEEPRQLIGIPPIRLHPIAGPARHARGTHDDALVAQAAEEQGNPRGPAS